MNKDFKLLKQIYSEPLPFEKMSDEEYSKINRVFLEKTEKLFRKSDIAAARSSSKKRGHNKLL